MVNRLGRAFFAIAIVAFGIQYLMYGHFTRGLPPVPPWTPAPPALAYLVGAVLVIAGLSILFNVRARLGALVTGTLFCLSALLLHTLRVKLVLLTGDARTGAFEALGLGCGAFVLAGELPVESTQANASQFVDRIAVVSRCVFAFSMIVFGVQHFMYAAYIATLVPAWLPLHLFLTYLAGAGFIAAGIAIALNVQARLGATLLGLMFLIWVLILHLPRSIAARTNGDEWTSLFVALGMSGAAWIVASSRAATRP